MCLINIAPPGKDWKSSIFTKAISHGFAGNKDLSGFMTYNVLTGDVYFERGFDKCEDMISAIGKRRLDKNEWLVTHHRMATHGTVNLTNCHPIPISLDYSMRCSDSFSKGILKKPQESFKGYALFMHNGIFSIKTHDNYSDSYCFAESVLKEGTALNMLYAYPDRFYKEMKKTLGWSKIVVIRPGLTKYKEGITIVGEFVVDDGYLFSNGGYGDYNNNSKYLEITESTNSVLDLDIIETFNSSKKLILPQSCANNTVTKPTIKDAKKATAAVEDLINETVNKEVTDDIVEETTLKISNSNNPFTTSLPSIYSTRLAKFEEELAEKKKQNANIQQRNQEKTGQREENIQNTVKSFSNWMLVCDENKHRFEIDYGYDQGYGYEMGGYDDPVTYDIFAVDAVKMSLEAQGVDNGVVKIERYLASLYSTYSRYDVAIKSSFKTFWTEVKTLIPQYKELGKNAKKKIAKQLINYNNSTITFVGINYNRDVILEVVAQYEWLKIYLSHKKDVQKLIEQRAIFLDDYLYYSGCYTSKVYEIEEDDFIKEGKL